jgi:HSP20 family protein
MLMRFDPFRDLDRLTQQLAGGWSPAMPMDAYRHADEVVTSFDIPGVDPASIEVTVDRNVLSVSAERQWHPAEGTEVLLSERPQGKVSRQVFLGDSLDTEHIEAHYADGVLTVRIPVAAHAKQRRIEVAAGTKSSELPVGAAA